MLNKLTIKKLTASDLTLFEWHFRNKNAGNQKSINLNRNVFIDKLFPTLPEIADSKGGRLPLDIHIYGPGLCGDYNLQRKIIKHGTYKNWRLNGEYIYNPDDNQDRFNCLEANDYVLFEFTGEFQPESTRAFFIAASLQDDAGLHHEFLDFTKGKSMVPITHAELSLLIESAAPPAEHPIHELLLEDLLEDAAYNGLAGTSGLNRRRSGKKMSIDELQKVRKNAERTGREGEEIINTLFENQLEDKSISGFEWTANENAIAPYDFKLTDHEGSHIRLDVKSTRGGFERKIHISIAELHEMADSTSRYDLYRVYEIHNETAKLRIARNLTPFASELLDLFEALPEGVTPDSISLNPHSITFEEEQTLSIPHDEEE